MKSPEVSVLVVCYNQRNLIGRAIDSVLAQQTDFDFEIVIGDDGSTDGTLELCRRYAEEHPGKVRVVGDGCNRGIVRNYFATLAECRGRYITDLAGDDYYIGVDRLQRQFDILESAPDVVMVHGDWVEESADGPRPMPSRGYVRGRQSGREMLVGVLRRNLPLAVHLSTAMFRADVARSVVAELGEVVCVPEWNMEDMPLLCALMSRGDAWYEPAVWLGYDRTGGDTLSKPASRRKLGEAYLHVTIATAVMARYYGVEPERLYASMKRDLQYVMAQAWHLRDRRLAGRVVDAAREYGLPMSAKVWAARLLLLV